MSTGTAELEERRSAMEAAGDALTGLSEVLPAASGAELAELLEVADRVAALASAARVALAVEAARRGEVGGSGVAAWLRRHAPSLRQGGAASVARIAVDVVGAGSALERTEPDAGSPLGRVWGAVREGALEAGTACAVLREVTRMQPLLRDEALPTVTDGLVILAEAHGTTTMRRLRPRLVAQYGHHGAFDDLQARLAPSARLSMPHVESADLTEYQLWMTPEQAATLEAAIGPLSKPAPNGETGERDLRPAGQRRVEALTRVCAAAATADGARPGSPATLHLTMTLTDLQQATGASTVMVSTADGTLLAPETVRRLGCDATVVPHLLDVTGMPLALGATVRLFTRAQHQHLWLRDRHCTYPGCTAPAAWTDAHHLRHWADGGPTDVTNAALLCERHHTLVHRRRLWGEVRDSTVVWDLTDGSYDRALAALPPPGRDPDPPPAVDDRHHLDADPNLDLDQWWDEFPVHTSDWHDTPAA